MTNQPAVNSMCSPSEIQVGEQTTLQFEISTVEDSPISTISLFFPFGDHPTDLSSEGTGVSLKSSTGSDWDIDPRGGGWYVLTPQGGTPRSVKQPLLLEVFVERVSDKIGTCLLKIQATVDGKQTSQQLSITKYPQIFRLDNFRAQPFFISPGSPVDLQWDFTPGMSPCSLTLSWPDQLGTQQKRDVYNTQMYRFPNQFGDQALQVDTLFELKADFGADVIISRYLNIQVEVPKILAFTSQDSGLGPIPPPLGSASDELLIGNRVKLSWSAQFIQSFELWISVHGEIVSREMLGKSTEFVHQPTQTTTYILKGFVENQNVDEKQLTLSVYQLDNPSVFSDFLFQKQLNFFFNDPETNDKILVIFSCLVFLKNGQSQIYFFKDFNPLFNKSLTFVENCPPELGLLDSPAIVPIPLGTTEPVSVLLFFSSTLESSLLCYSFQEPSSVISPIGPSFASIRLEKQLKLDVPLEELYLLPNREKLYGGIHTPESFSLYSFNGIDPDTIAIKKTPLTVNYKIEKVWVSASSSLLCLLSKSVEDDAHPIDRFTIVETTSDRIVFDRLPAGTSIVLKSNNIFLHSDPSLTTIFMAPKTFLE